MITHDLRLIADAVLDKKGENVISLDLRGIDGAITDYFVICDASNTTQVGAVADNILEKMEEEGHRLLRSQGEGNNFWIIQDYGNILVHIFLTGISTGWKTFGRTCPGKSTRNGRKPPKSSKPWPNRTRTTKTRNPRDSSSGYPR